MTAWRIAVFLLVCSVLGISCGSSSVAPTREQTSAPPEPKPPELPRSFVHQGTRPSWVEDALSSLTLEEKVGQLIMARAYGSYLSSTTDEYDRLVRLVQDLRVGGLIMFQGEVYSNAILLNKLQRRAKVPLLVASDFERGAAMRIRRATSFPDAMAIGATRNPDYAYRVALATAREARAIGVHQNFAPVADVNNNPANPVINTRSFGEDPAMVAQMVEAYVRGTNDGGAISTAKHFPGHGDTGVDSHLDLLVLPFDRARLDSIEFVSFRRAVASGVMSVMIAHLEIPAIDSTPGIPATLSSATVSGLLQQEMGFEGLVVTDALDMAGLTKGYSIGESAVRAFKAGVDVLLCPSNEQVAVNALVAAVRRGEISEDRLNTSVEKILLVKHALNLDEVREVDIERIDERVGTLEHWKLAKDVARDAITVVKNEGAILPLTQYGRKKVVSVLISDTDDNRTEVNRPGLSLPNEPVGAYFSQQFRRRYGNVEMYRLTPSSNQIDFDSIITRARTADIVLLPLYVKVRSATGKIGIPEKLAPFVAKINELGKPTVVVSFGNPYLVGSFPNARALVCAYADAEVLVEAAVEGLFGEINVRGKLPVSIPGMFKYGDGIEYAQVYLRKDDPSYAGFDALKLRDVEKIVAEGIRDSAFPAAQIAVVRNGIVVLNKSFGTLTYDPSSRETNSSTMFDIASLTKVVATTTAVMKLYDGKKLPLDDPVSKYIPQFSSGSKSRMTIRHLLTHTGGFKPFLTLIDVCKTPQETLDSIYASQLVAAPGDTVIYSDLGMIVLGKVVEKIAGMTLDRYVKETFFEPLGMNSTGFNPPQSTWKSIAPTEVDTVWRKRLVQGTVHDERSALLGGVAGHAGLFSNTTDLSMFMQMLLNRGTYGGVRYLSPETVELFTRRQPGAGTRALGWDTKSPKGSSAGELFSQSSFGHTGFTGTSIWVDPERNMSVILLTNRVHPTRANGKIFMVRPAVHDAVVRAIVGDAYSGTGQTQSARVVH
jgi:beta-N-acetylhexosaminidase